MLGLPPIMDASIIGSGRDGDLDELLLCVFSFLSVCPDNELTTIRDTNRIGPMVRRPAL